jgi:5-methylcytosine-specific restriction endonuclease McrA
MIYNCLRCNKQFEDEYVDRKYCSLLCSKRKLEGRCLDCQKPIHSIQVRCFDCRKKISDAWPEKLKILRRRKSWTTGREPRGRHQHLKKFLRNDGVSLLDPLWNLNFYTALIQDSECHYCLGPLSPTGHALDRKNSESGHEACNVVPCCWPCNSIKGKYWEYEHMMLLAPKLRKSRVLPDAPDDRGTLS